MSDLKGQIESPGYYFKDALPETRKNLDLLMLVHGWRRFTWKDVLDSTDSKLQYLREQGIPISGRVMKATGKKALSGSKLKIMTMHGNLVMVEPDSLGYFYNDDLLFYDSLNLVIQVENERGKKQPNTFLLDPMDPPASSDHAMSVFTSFQAPAYIKQQAEKNSIDKRIEGTLLQEFVLHEKKPDPIESKMMGFRANAILVGPEIGKYFNNVFELLESRQQPGVEVIRDMSKGLMSIKVRGKFPVMYLNGSLSTPDEISMIPASHVELMEIDKMRGTLNVVLRENIFDREPIGMSSVKYPGLYNSREFYSPRYDVPHPRHTVPDKRVTLYWKPVIETDITGRAVVSFFAADVTSRYRIVLEGITPDGCPGTASVTFTVE